MELVAMLLLSFTINAPGTESCFNVIFLLAFKLCDYMIWVSWDDKNMHIFHMLNIFSMHKRLNHFPLQTSAPTWKIMNAGLVALPPSVAQNVCNWDVAIIELLDSMCPNVTIIQVDKLNNVSIQSVVRYLEIASAILNYVIRSQKVIRNCQ